MEQYAIVIPAMNEQDSIAGVIQDIRASSAGEIIVVDDGSSDNTAKIAKELGAVVLKHVVNMGAWRATQTGLKYALENGFDKVVTMDADGQHKAVDIGTLLEKANQGSDLVIGACTKRGSRGRHIAWYLFQRITGLPVRDLTSGFRCYSQRALQVLVSRQATMFEYQDIGVLLMLRNVQLTCSEVQVQMGDRHNGISRIFHSWTAVFSYLLYTLILSMTKALPSSAKAYYKKLTSGDSIE